MFAAFLSTVCGSLLSICVTALSAFSVTIIFRTSTTANFAQGSIAAFGCYVVAECLNRWGVPVYLGVLPGMIVGVVIGLFIDLMVFRKGRHVGELGKQIITMGFVSLFYGGIPLVFGNPEFIPFESFYNTTKAGVESNVVLRAFGGEIVLTKHALICAAITAVVLAALFLLLKYSKWGLGVRCTASSEFTAELMGINTVTKNVKAATVSDSRLETYSLYYLLYFFFRLTTVVPITAPPLMNRSALHKTGLLLSPVFDEAVFPGLSGWSLGFTVEPFAGIATAAFL